MRQKYSKLFVYLIVICAVVLSLVYAYLIAGTA